MKKKLLFVANWKMYFNFDQDLLFATEHYDQFIHLAENSNHEIILCPSFLALATLGKIFNSTKIKIGAQDCSDHHKGAFTGQISALSLKKAGCSYSIIGHSERRINNGETDQAVAQKCLQIIEQDMIPIVCIGENADDYAQGRAFTVLEKQIEKICAIIKNDSYKLKNSSLCIAYEPLWAIGTGTIPSPVHLETVFAWLSTQLSKASLSVEWKLLYGGSVNASSITLLKNFAHLDGFLVGGASLDFQEFEKIVHYAV